MGRAFWFAAGVGTAVYGSVKARRLAYRVSAAGLADQVAALRLGGQALLDDIRASAHEREQQLVDGRTDARPASPARFVPPPPRAVDKDTT